MSRPRVGLFLEQHLGHRTFAQNLRTVADQVTNVDVSFVDINYAADAGIWERAIVPGSLRAVMRSRREMASARSAFDVHVFNTQVPAVIGPRWVRARPYVLCTDITPMQMDAAAVDYRHRTSRTGAARIAKHSWNRHVIQNAAAVVGWSTWARDSLISDYGVDPGRCCVIAPGVDTARFSQPLDRDDRVPRILFVGGDFERKGGYDLLEAFAVLPRGLAELVIVTKSGIDSGPGITIVSDLVPNDPGLIELFSTSDVFVLPSYAEAFGIAAIEASAAGLPLVATDVGGLADIVEHGVTGFVVPPRDPVSLADALRTLLTSVELRRRMGAAAERRARVKFDAATNGRALLDLARSVVA